MLIQLAGHLNGRARQEWSLLGESKTSDYEKAVRALRARLDPGSKALAAQDFRHAAQEESEKVNDFIRRIEKTFRRAYGHDSMLSETRDALLYAQLQEDLKNELMKAPSVSGALSYEALCVAAKSEERRLAELQKRKQYQLPQPKQATSQPQMSSSGSQFKPGQRSGSSSGASQSKQGKEDNSSIDPGSKKCWNCNETGWVHGLQLSQGEKVLADRIINQPVPRWLGVLRLLLFLQRYWMIRYSTCYLIPRIQVM